MTVKFSQSLAHRGSLDRICAAREILRKYFIHSGYKQALWVDSDIILPPETPEVLMDVMETVMSQIVY